MNEKDKSKEREKDKENKNREVNNRKSPAKDDKPVRARSRYEIDICTI